MRPVDKLHPGDKIVLGDSTTAEVQSAYKPYRLAKSVLTANLGCFCSYCECGYEYGRDLQVEHIQAKSIDKYADKINDWDNFLLSCSTCNGKDNKGEKDITIGKCHLPHLNNTFLSLVYKAGGVVMVNPSLSGESASNAQNLLTLVGLDKSPKTSSASNTRWKKRSEIWNLAQKYLEKYNDGKTDADTIVDLVKHIGMWSIWFTGFKDKDEVLKHLVNDIPGTAVGCFDSKNHYFPIPRNPRLDDPV